MILLGLAIAGLLLSILPLLLAIGSHPWRDAAPEAVLDMLIAQKTAVALTIVLLLVVFGGALLVVVAIHSFVEAGTIGVYLDGERRAAAGSVAVSEFRAFSTESWIGWGKRNWWRLFLLYNLVWGVFGFVLLIPIVLVSIPMLIWRDSPAVLVGGCLAFAVIVGLTVIAGLVASLWSSVAAVILVRSGTGANHSLRLALSLARTRLRDLIIVVAGRVAAGVALQGVFTSVWFGMGAFARVPGMNLALIPLQGAFTTIQVALSMLISAWFLAGLAGVALAAEGRSSDAVR